MLARRLCLMFSVLFGLQAIAVADGKVRLFILSGQSNMAYLDPKVSFEPAVKAAFPGDEVILVKYAVGGQPIRRWSKSWKLPEGATDDEKVAKLPPGNMYDKLMTMTAEAIGDKKPDSVAFIWMQGENDARRGWHEAYETALAGLIGQVRTDLKRDDVVFVVGRLSDYEKDAPGQKAVRAAQVKVAEADKFGAWVDTDDLNNFGGKDALHYTKQGSAELGKRFAAEAIELIRKSEASR